jgi:hypothetical protein
LTLAALKLFGPWVALGLVVAAFGLLTLDRNHLAALNNQHAACLASVKAAPGAKPLDVVCDPAIATAAEDAAAAAACDHALTDHDVFAAGQACSGPVKALIAASQAGDEEIVNLNAQLAGATADRDAAVARAATRATVSAQGLSHAQSVLAALKPGSDGLDVCDAGCLRELAGGAVAGPRQGP